MTPISSPSILSTQGLSMAYAGIRALEHVDIEFRAGEIHALCGENGAGKSTLIKILGGIIPWGAYTGLLQKGREECSFKNPRSAIKAGIAIIHQELALASDCTVAENIFLGREPTRFGFLDRDRMVAESSQVLASLGQNDILPDQVVRTLPVGKMQMVEIARALKTEGTGSILILDEPTSALSSRESQILLALLLKLKSQGLSIVYVSHKLEEVFAIADRITILRNGRSIKTLERPSREKNATQDSPTEFYPNAIIALMVGRKLEEVFPARNLKSFANEPVLLSVRNWTVPFALNPEVDVLKDISFDLRRGEILGIAGLMGSGRTELVESLFGTGIESRQGEVQINGKAFHPGKPSDAIAQGLALVPEDRRRHGLMLEKSIRHNLTSACLERFCDLSQFINQDKEIQQVGRSIRELGIKTPSESGDFIASMLSGGNQQKVVLAKWLLTKPSILFLDEPTRGVDVGAKAEIYRIILDLAATGIAIVLISSENEEVLQLSHRILVLRQGRSVGEFEAEKIDPKMILELCTGRVNK